MITLALGALVAAALVGPAGASAAQQAEDPTNGGDWDQTDPPTYGSAPDQPHNTGSATPCLWTVKGRLYVRNPRLDGITDGEPLAGVEIKVSGADSLGSLGGVFGNWRTTHTNANGEFSLTHNATWPQGRGRSVQGPRRAGCELIRGVCPRSSRTRLEP